MSEETDVPQIDTQIDTIFIDDNELFDKDELTDENKAFIKTVLDKANYKDILDDIKDDQQKVVQDDLSNVPLPRTADMKTEIIDDVVPPNDRVFFLTENEIFDDVVPADVFTPKTEKFIPYLTPPKKAGIKSFDDKNYEDYLKVLQIYRPDLFIDEEDNNNYVIPTPKTEIIEIEDVVPPTPLRPIPIIPQETVKLPKTIPKTHLPENIDIISAISDINKIISPNQFDNVDGDNSIVEQQTSDDDIKYIPLPEVPVPRPIHPRETRKQKLRLIREQKERYRENAKKKDINFLNKKMLLSSLKNIKNSKRLIRKLMKKNQTLIKCRKQAKKKTKGYGKVNR